MSLDIAPAVFTPDTGAADKLVVSALIPIGRPSIGFQYRFELLTTPHRSVYFRSASISTPDRFHPPMVNAFSLLTHAVQYQPLEREAPQGGLESLPVKRIRETSPGL